MFWNVLKPFYRYREVIDLEEYVAERAGEFPESYAKDAAAMERTHQLLVTSILEEHEDLMLVHRQQIDDQMEFIQTEMNLLAVMDQPGSSIEEYINELDTILGAKMKVVRDLQHRLEGFKDKLREEEDLSKTFKQLSGSSGRK
eukprot:TRINITY_DN2072_c0_g1_i3.p1 TRINITY_DN2072_c0_g1~~TRINITY_DN2072_c0_g1_i3.p1  ORF type:complete len:143 (-),score=57.94 TRINITY_DN2072_c0_g1_i3:48-476(-)